MEYKVSIIVPVYNVSPFLPRCIQSLMKQTLSDVEYIFVDDCSTDDSYDVLWRELQKYSPRLEHVQVIRHPQNKGLPSARNSGLKRAKGEFVFHCDSDDYLEIDAMELLFEVAKSEGSDLVWCDWFLTYPKSERYMSQKMILEVTPLHYLTEILYGRLKYNVWNKFIKRSLYERNQISFPDGYGMGEDMTMIKLVAVAAKVSYLPKALYHYLKYNTEAFTNNFNDKHFSQMLHNAEDTFSFLQNISIEEVEEVINGFKLNLKFPFLISNSYSSYRIWVTLYPESNKFIMKNPYIGVRAKLLQWLASNRLFFLLWIYNQVVYKFIYRLRFK